MANLIDKLEHIVGRKLEADEVELFRVVDQDGAV